MLGLRRGIRKVSLEFLDASIGPEKVLLGSGLRVNMVLNVPNKVLDTLVGGLKNDSMLNFRNIKIMRQGLALEPEFIKGPGRPYFLNLKALDLNGIIGPGRGLIFDSLKAGRVTMIY